MGLTINRDKIDLRLIHSEVWLGGGWDVGLTVSGVNQLPPDLHLVGDVGVQERDQPALPLVATLGEEGDPASGQEVSQGQLEVRQNLGLGGQVRAPHTQRPRVHSVGEGRLVETDKGVGVIPKCTCTCGYVYTCSLFWAFRIS